MRVSLHSRAVLCEKGHGWSLHDDRHPSAREVSSASRTATDAWPNQHCFTKARIAHVANVSERHVCSQPPCWVPARMPHNHDHGHGCARACRQQGQHRITPVVPPASQYARNSTPDAASSVQSATDVCLGGMHAKCTTTDIVPCNIQVPCVRAERTISLWTPKSLWRRKVGSGA